MCGLFGALSSTLTNDEVDNVKFLALLASTRGTDSTGVAILSRRDKGKIALTVHKEMGNSCSFLMSPESKKVFDGGSKFAIMGHTRWATLGAINLYNAQPVEEDNIVLCHNGSIDHFLKDKKDEKNSDSRELAHRLSSRTVTDALRSVGNGHYAITYADLETRTIHLVRNMHRPLCFMFDSAKQTFYWASELWMLECLAFKKGIRNFCKPEWLKVDAMWTFPFASVQGKVSILDLEPPKPVVEAKKSHIFSKETKLIGPPVSAASIFCRFCKNRNTACTCDTEDDLKLDTSGLGMMKKLTAVPSISSEFKGMTYKGYNGMRLSVAAVVPRLKKGCSCCAAPATPRETVTWFANDEFVCKKCLDNDQVCQNYLVNDKRLYESQLVKAN